jgi:hypothetical protein
VPAAGSSLLLPSLRETPAAALSAPQQLSLQLLLVNSGTKACCCFCVVSQGSQASQPQLLLAGLPPLLPLLLLPQPLLLLPPKLLSPLLLHSVAAAGL